MTDREKREQCLRKANECVNGDRDEAYGNAENNFDHIAEMWTAYLKDRLCADIDALDVSNMMIMLKMARISANGFHLDNYIDIAGYAACAYGIAQQQNEDVESAFAGANFEQALKSAFEGAKITLREEA